jgi:hypothetical protein
MADIAAALTSHAPWSPGSPRSAGPSSGTACERPHPELPVQQHARLLRRLAGSHHEPSPGGARLMRLTPRKVPEAPEWNPYLIRRVFRPRFKV